MVRRSHWITCRLTVRTAPASTSFASLAVATCSQVSTRPLPLNTVRRSLYSYLLPPQSLPDATHSAFAILVHPCAVACSAVSMLVYSLVAQRYSAPTCACDGPVHSSKAATATRARQLHAFESMARSSIPPFDRSWRRRASREARVPR